MKNYSPFRLKCDCSKRMKTRGAMVGICKTPTARRCPNCHKIYAIARKDTCEIVSRHIS